MQRIQQLQSLFPSADGNEEERKQFLQWIEQLVSGMDEMKDAERATLTGCKQREDICYEQIKIDSHIPHHGLKMEQVILLLLKLIENHPYHSKYYFSNIHPMASIPSMLGTLVMMLTNGNNIWDVSGPAGAEAEVGVMSMMSKLVGYNHLESGGYTTWGGQGAVFTGLRLAISKAAPDSIADGVPNHLYVFASEAAHFSILKSVEAAGLGRNKLIKVKTNTNNEMDVLDLERKMIQVIENGGLPIYVVATTGTTDSMAIDNIKDIADMSFSIAKQYGVQRPHIHGDSALGGFFAFFNDYDMKENKWGFSNEVITALSEIKEKLKYLYVCDSICFDFHKLGQSPYVSSLFLVKQARDLKLLDISPEDTPYIGHRAYGEYHTGYTLECSRMCSAISMYSTLMAFGMENYQKLLAHYVEVNLVLRKRLKNIDGLCIVNDGNAGMVTLFRIYHHTIRDGFVLEKNGLLYAAEVEENNKRNEMLFEQLGENRDKMFFGDTQKHCSVPTKDGSTVSVNACKIFITSPYTEIKHVDDIVDYVQQMIQQSQQRMQQRVKSV
ncbi:pyridoxal phosphate-dependent decarboxylase family protein [Longirhabdus pacifica]|uniref:pyridoxal phosphate-dependent decarboxylase family protein n=1 Tax=Longirhabdus pacifica TaxID=2305227 RepID=UPI00100878E1|nr:pyridoxal-dependent decarboxylase [Longirhabdus pacifica]